MQRSSALKLGLGVVAVIVVLAGVGVWYFFVRDDAPPEATLVDRPTATTADDGSTDASVDGAWEVAAGTDSFAGFRITEEFPGFDNTAVVRSQQVDGALTIAGSEITEVTVTADLTALESKDAQPPGAPGIENRVDQLRDDGLETERFPTAEFTLNEPITLDGPPQVDEGVEATAEGDLTIHGETQTVTIPVEARWNGEVIDVAGSLEVALADYGMEPPDRPFVTVSDIGTMEFQLTFAR